MSFPGLILVLYIYKYLVWKMNGKEANYYDLHLLIVTLVTYFLMIYPLANTEDRRS
jgi:hypothetical protein